MNLKELLAESKKALDSKKAARAKAVNGGSKNVVKKTEISAKAKSTLRGFGVKSMDELIHVNTADKKFAYLGNEAVESVKNLKEQVDVAVMVASIFKKSVKDTEIYKNELEFTLKSFGINSGDEGYEWIPTMVASSYLEEHNLERKVSGLFMEIKMPSNPYKFPVMSNGAIARKVGQATATGKQVFKTDNTITFDAEKLASRYELPEELNEDSAPDVIRVIRNELISGQEKALEIAILEGDTLGTMHIFSQLPDVAVGTTIASIAATSPETAFDGIRKRVKGTAGFIDGLGAKIDEVVMGKMRKSMGKFGVDPKQLAYISGVKLYSDLGQLNDVRTLDVYGPQAVVLTGELAKYEGTPIVVSEYLREDTDATGANVLVANDKSSLMLVNRKRWFLGLRRAIQIKVEANKTEFDVMDMVSFSRRAFQAVLKADGSNFADESSASVAFNLLV